MATITGTVGGHSIEGYVRSFRRRGHICAPGQTFTLTLDPSFPFDVNPADDVVLNEQGIKVLTGYVFKANRSKPSFDWVVEGMDTYHRVQAYFIEDVINVGHDPVTDEPVKFYVPQLTDYWIGYLMGLCGASYSLASPGHTVPQGVQLGLRTVHESLQDLMAYSSQYAWANKDGVIVIGRANRDAKDHDLTQFIQFEYREDDEWTRTTVKVFGLNSGYGSRQQRIFATASVSLPNIIPDRVTAIATPMIQTQDEAQRVADYMIQELGEVTWVATGTVVGNPHIRVGQSARMAYLDFDRTDVITSLESDWDENGYIMKVTTGERCPRISGWSKRNPPVYAGTTANGIYRSTDGGVNWTEFNTGLPTGTKYVTRMGFNSFDEGMAIVNRALYYTDGLDMTWHSRTLSAPQNMAGDSPAPGYGRMVACDATGALGTFAVLTTGIASSGSTSGSTSGSIPQESRAWLYTCTNSGSTPSAWESTELSTGSMTAHPYNLIGLDMTSNMGAPISIACSGSTWSGVAAHTWIVSKNKDAARIYSYKEGGFGARVCRTATLSEGILDWRVEKTVVEDTATRITIRLTLPTAQYDDGVFMYGSVVRGLDTPVKDSQDFWIWDTQYNFMKVAPYTWEKTITLDNSDPLTTMGFDAIYFNFFWVKTLPGSLDRVMAYGADCDYFQVGTSPNGDTYHIIKNPNVRYPILSHLTAGIIYYI